MNRDQLSRFREEHFDYLTKELMPFWLNRMKDDTYGGFITHFDRNGEDSGEDEKSLIAQTRSVYTMSSLHRNGYGDGVCGEYASHGVDYLINRMWDKKHGGFYWMTDRKGNVTMDGKILYGLSFAIYALSEYTLATGDPRGLKFAEATFDLVQTHCADAALGGYLEMFSPDWKLNGPGGLGGDRKTLDVHMHLMEAFTALFECSGKELHRKALEEDISILINKMMNPEWYTGIPQFFKDWQPAPQIKFDIVWGWDRFSEEGVKTQAEDNTSYGHNTEFSWLLDHALTVMGENKGKYTEVLRKPMDHALKYGIDPDYGGVFVEGSHRGEVYDREKEFWQQAEVMIGMLSAYLLFGNDDYLEGYEKVHTFVFEKMINHEVGEWWPLTTREGKPIWTHMSHSWKVNYHTLRCSIECIKRLDTIAD